MYLNKTDSLVTLHTLTSIFMLIKITLL